MIRNPKTFLSMLLKPTLVGLLMLMILYLPRTVEATIDPMARSNNHFGIHISTEADLEDAAKLVNSSGGDWGYVTVVIQDNDQNQDKWQSMFNRMRELHLIPLVRLATHAEGGVWVKPMEHQLGNWAGFLNSLNWVIKNRYVILFNEPNQKKEWGGEANPEEYAKIAKKLAEQLKAASNDFFILPAGMDAAAPTGPTTLDSQEFFRRMHQAEPDFFGMLDGWVSHSYPNPGFRGSPNDSGKMSIRGYAWELDYLSQFGLKQNIPVFITETGWVHQQGRVLNRSNLNPQTVANYFKTAFTQAWKDERITAITPFILRYDQPPFDYFSWSNADGSGYLPHYQVIQELPKIAGNPEQIDKAEYVEGFLPKSLLAASDYMVKVSFKNVGQAIWNAENYRMGVEGDIETSSLWVSPIETIKPGEEVSVWIRFTTTTQPVTGQLKINLLKNEAPISADVYHEFITAKPINLVAQLKLVFQLLLHPTLFSIARN